MDSKVRSAAGAGASILALGAIAVVAGANNTSTLPAVRNSRVVHGRMSKADRAYTHWTSGVATDASSLMSEVFEAAAEGDRDKLSRLGGEMMDEFVVWNAESEGHVPDHEQLAHAHSLVQQAYTNFGAAGMVLADPGEKDLDSATDLIHTGIGFQSEATKILVGLAA